MELKLIKEIDQPLLNRKEYVFELIHEGKQTPTKNDVRSLVAKKVKAKDELVAVVKIEQNYAMPKSEVVARVYSDKEYLTNFEKKRNVLEVKEENGKEESKE